MFSPRQNKSYNKYSLYIEHPSFSSYYQTESTSRISLSELKNINILKKSINSYNRKKLFSEKYKTSQCSSKKVSKINLKNNNFLYSILKNRTSTNFHKNILFNNKTKSRNEKNFSLYSTYDNNYKEKKYAYQVRLKTKEPFYQLCTSRNNSFIDFKKDTRNLRYLKINSYNGKKAIDRLKENIFYNNAKAELSKINNTKSQHLMNIYNQNLYSYLVYLYQKRDEEYVTNYNLSNKKKLLINEIVSLKKKINKNLFKFESYLDIKFFLLCVKENNIDYKKFSNELKTEILYDLYKYYLHRKRLDEFLYNIYNNNDNEKNNVYIFYNYIIKITQNIKNCYDSSKRNLFLYNILKTLEKNYLFDNFHKLNSYNIKYNKLNNIFISSEEFHKKMSDISSNNKFLLTNFNSLSIDLSNLRSEMIKEIQQKNKENSIVKIKRNNNDLIEEKLNILKKSYYNELSTYNNSKKKYKGITNNIKVINKKINLIIKTIMDYKLNNSFVIKINIDQTSTLIEKMIFCENIINCLLKYKNEQMIKNPNNYNKIIKDIKAEQIINRLKNREEIMKQIVNLKYQKIIERNNKILFIPHKKIKENIIKMKKTKLK